MSKKPEISEEDTNLFQEAMRGVKRIPAPKKTTSTPPPLKPKRKKESDTQEPEFLLSDYDTFDSVSSADLVEYTKGGLQHKVLRKLRSGQYNVEAILDLHGMTAIEARTALEAFLTHCRDKGLSHTLIIHGKGRLTGKPVLKNKLNLWLRQVPFVLAFCSAKHKDGSSGAMHVLLQKTGQITRGK